MKVKWEFLAILAVHAFLFSNTSNAANPLGK